MYIKPIFTIEKSHEIVYVSSMKATFLVILLSLLGVVSQVSLAIELDVELKGLDGNLTSHIKRYLDVFRTDAKNNQTVNRIEQYHSKAPEQIRTALQVYGYYRPEINSELIRTGEKWRAVYTVDPGPAVAIGSIDIQIKGEGKDNPAIQSIIQKFPIQTGMLVNHPEYDAARYLLVRAARQQGYIDATYTKRELRIDLKKYLASIVLHMDTGKRYYFGKVSLHQTEMDESFVMRFINFNEGDVYSPAKLLQLQRQLNDSGLFQSVQITPDRTNTIGDKIPVQVHLTGRKRNEWRFGLGYATDTGARGSVNHSRIVGNKGHRFDARSLIAEKKDSLLLAYIIPLHDPVTDQLSFSYEYSDEITDSRQSKIHGVSTTHTSNWADWQRSIGLNYEQETYIVGTESEESRSILFPSISVSRVKSDNRLKTTKGNRVYAELRGANENLFSDTNYGQIRLGLKWIQSFAADYRILLRGDFGATNVGQLDKLPASQRFFAGGDNSVRGYAFEELGPVNDAGEVIGGKHLMVGSIELERRIAGNWSGALFYDIGNAVNSFSDELYDSAGLGVRWNSPVGPVRFDFAWALDKVQDQFRLHIVIGPDL